MTWPRYVKQRDAVSRAVVLPHRKKIDNRVLILSEGTTVSVYVQGEGVQVQHIEVPYVREPAAIDYVEQNWSRILGLYWHEVYEEGYHRMTFQADGRTFVERDRMMWPLAYDVIRGGKRVATTAAVMVGPGFKDDR